MSKEKLSRLLKHKRIIIVSLVLFGFILVVSLTYVLTYVNNKPVIFDNKKAKIVKSEDLKDFDLEVEATKITYKKGSSNGSLKYIATISNLDSDIKNVSIQYELNTKWTDTELSETSTDSFNNKNIIRVGEESKTSTHTSTLKTDFPIKVLPFVKVTKKDIIIYAKVTYTVCSATGLFDKEKTVYTYFTYSDYVTSDTTFA